MTGREIPRHPGERHQDPANARTIRARTNSGEQAKSQRTTYAEGAPVVAFRPCDNVFVMRTRGGGNIPISKPFRTRADRRHNRPAPSSRIPCTAPAAPGPGREDRAENTRRTGGRGPGRDFSKKSLCVSARRMARRKGPGVEGFTGLSPPA